MPVVRGGPRAAPAAITAPHISQKKMGIFLKILRSAPLVEDGPNFKNNYFFSGQVEGASPKLCACNFYPARSWGPGAVTQKEASRESEMSATEKQSGQARRCSGARLESHAKSAHQAALALGLICSPCPVSAGAQTRGGLLFSLLSFSVCLGSWVGEKCVFIRSAVRLLLPQREDGLVSFCR